MVSKYLGKDLRTNCPKKFTEAFKYRNTQTLFEIVQK